MKSDSLASVRLGNQSVRLMCDVLAQAGIDWLPLLAAAGITADVVEDPGGRVSGLDELHFQQSFARATRRIPGLWFHTGLRYRLTAHGCLGLMALASETVEQALTGVVGSMQGLSFSMVHYSLVHDGGELHGLEADDSGLPPDFRKFCRERDLGIATTFLHDLLQRPFPFERIETPLQRPRGWRGWEHSLKARLTFGAQTTRWLFRPGTGSIRLPMANKLLETTYRRLCAETLELALTSDEFVQKLTRLLLHGQSGVRSAAEIAPQLGVSERTLYRKLAQRNLSFGDLLDQVREKQACELLKSSWLPINKIAEKLGFTESASFSRAFKRWTGTAPLEFRKRHTS
jgi:AraC-like DNA-binding protein